MAYPRTRPEAERDINNLAGWPEALGNIDDASDDVVIGIACEQYECDELAAKTGRPVRWDLDSSLTVRQHGYF